MDRDYPRVKIRACGWRVSILRPTPILPAAAGVVATVLQVPEVSGTNCGVPVCNFLDLAYAIAPGPGGTALVFPVPMLFALTRRYYPARAGVLLAGTVTVSDDSEVGGALVVVSGYPADEWILTVACSQPITLDLGGWAQWVPSPTPSYLAGPTVTLTTKPST